MRESVSVRSSSSAALREQMVTFIDKMQGNCANTEAEIVERYMEAVEQKGVTLTRDEVMDELAANFAGDMLDDADHPFSTILADAQPVYVEKDLPGEYKSSEYTKTMKSALRKIKMQTASSLDEMLLLAENGEWRENVKPQFSLKAPVEVEKKGHVKSAKEFFEETNNWNETGYITTDGTKLDFSGRHEGAPGGQTGRRGDGRDRRGAV